MSELRVIKFEKPSCAPCVAVSEMLDKAGVEHEKVNYITAIDMAQEMGVRSVPTVFAVRKSTEPSDNGKLVAVYSCRGANPDDINKFVADIASYYDANVVKENG